MLFFYASKSPKLMMVIAVDNTALFRAQSMLINKKIDQDARTRTVSTFSHYCAHAQQILSDISQIRDLVLDNRKEYILCSNVVSIYGVQKFMSDEVSRKFDQETDFALKHCTKLIQSLEAQIHSDRALRPDQLKHLLAVVTLLNAYLKKVLSIVTEIRSIRVRKSRQIRRISRLANLVEMYGPQIEQSQKEEEEKALHLANLVETYGSRIEQSKKEEEEKPLHLANFVETDEPQIEQSQKEEEEKPLYLANFVDTDEPQIEQSQKEEEKTALRQERVLEEPKESEQHQWKREEMHEEQPQLLKENKNLFKRFTATNTELTRIETQMSEVQRLQCIFAEKISEQEQEIDVIHSRTVYTLDNLETANEFIREAITNQANRRVILIFCLLVLTFTLLFLDWYNP